LDDDDAETEDRGRGRERPARSNPYLLATYGAALALLSTVGLAMFNKPKLDEFLSRFGGWPHRYSFQYGGQRISGESHSAFKRGDGYLARVEGCRKLGVEGIFVADSCLVTIRPTSSLTVTNSENPTAAIYDDGSKASICCMAIGDDDEEPLYQDKVPPGVAHQRTYESGADIHLVLNIPNAGLQRELDAVSFSPGQGVPPVLFPVRDRTASGVLSAAFIEAHSGDPEIRAFVEDSMRMRDQILARERVRP
jgi:hypothetical protein